MDDVLIFRAHGSRLLLAALLLVASLCGVAAVAIAAPPAHAADAVLWACHGPDGRALGDGGLVASAIGDGTTAPYGAGCAAPGTASGGLRASAGAAWRASVPAGLTLHGVTVTRRATDDAYTLSDGAGVLESGALGDATVTLAASGAEVRASAVDLSALGLRVSDDVVPRASVGGLVSPAAGSLSLVVHASDVGTGLASATVGVDGVTVATSALCDELTPGDGQVDLALTALCPAGADVSLPIDTTKYADGEHRVQVVVRDVAGNTTVALDQAILVRNAPVTTTTSITVGVGSGDGAGSVDGAGDGGSGGSTGGASSGGGTAAVACAKPKLSMMLAQKPLRTVKGKPVLRRGHRYRFTGRLTCLRGTRRVSAARGTKIELLNVIGKRTVGKSGTTVRTGGQITILLAYPSSRTIEFRYRSADGSTSRVRIPVTVARR